MVLSGHQGEIIKSGKEDVPELFRLWSGMIKDNTTEAKIREMVEDSRGRRDRVLLLKINGNIEGFIAYNEKKGNGHISGIAVKEKRNGYGSRLLEAAEDELKKSGFAGVILEVEPSNISAIWFYLENGYKFLGEEQDFYGAGRKALLFKKGWKK